MALIKRNVSCELVKNKSKDDTDSTEDNKIIMKRTFKQTGALSELQWTAKAIVKQEFVQYTVCIAQLTKIYPPLLTSIQPISITKTLLIVPTKNERDHPLFTGKLLIKFQNILRSTTQVIIRHRVNNPIFRHIKSNNSGTTKVQIVKNERDAPLFIGKLVIKFQNIPRNTTQVIIRHRVKILFSVISSPITLERQK
jgi:hypothetical protein